MIVCSINVTIELIDCSLASTWLKFSLFVTIIITIKLLIVHHNHCHYQAINQVRALSCNQTSCLLACTNFIMLEHLDRLLVHNCCNQTHWSFIQATSLQSNSLNLLKCFLQSSRGTWSTEALLGIVTRCTSKKQSKFKGIVDEEDQV